MSNRILLAILFCSGFMTAHSTVPTDSSSFRLHGYLKFLHETDAIREPDTLLTSQLIHQRFDLSWKISDRFYLRGALRTRFYYGQAIGAYQDFGKRLEQRQQLFRLDRLLINHGQIVLFTESDRLYAGYQGERLDVSIGRQRINWGTNLIWNPNDIFNTYSILDFDYEERQGTDALRVQFSLNEKSTLDVAAAPEPDSNSAYAGMLRYHIGTYDLQFLAGTVNRHGVAGIGWAGNLGRAGFKGEATWYAPTKIQEQQLMASLTLDYGPGKGWYTYASILLQTSVQQQIPEIISTRMSVPYARYLMPYHVSVYAGAMKELNPIWSTQMALIYGDYHHSLIAFPTVSCTAAENLQLLLSAQIYLRKSEHFGWEAGSVFLRMRWDF